MTYQFSEYQSSLNRLFRYSGKSDSPIDLTGQVQDGFKRTYYLFPQIMLATMFKYERGMRLAQDDIEAKKKKKHASLIQITKAKLLQCGQSSADTFHVFWISTR